MRGLNKAYLIGTIGADVEIRTSPGGATVARVSLSTPSVRSVDGEAVDVPDWHRLTAHGTEATYLADRGVKGSTLAVECVIRPNRWTDKDGHTHVDAALVVDRVLFLSAPRPVPAGG